MLVERNGVVYSIDNQAQIDAFLSYGFKEVTEATPKKVAEEPTAEPKKEKKTLKKAKVSK